MSFIHAAFLAAGLAVAIPWLLHLTRKRKYLRIRIGSLQFLDPIVRDRHRMSRIEQWPLLLLRCLAILLLALVFARPFFPKPAPAPPVVGESLLLLDASGSITPKQADAIRKQAEKTLSSLPKATRPVIAAVSDRVEILASLDAYQPVAGSPGNFSKAIDWVVDRAAAAPDAMAKVHWFTDLQRSSLPSAPARLWPSGLNVEVHPALPPADQNVVIGQIDLLTPFGGNHWEIEARVQVYGMPGTAPLNVALTTADGKTVATTTPSDGGTARFSWEGEAAHGILSGSVAVVRAGDAWPVDDKRPFAFATTQPKRIVLVDGDPGDSPFLSETYFLEKALHASAAGKALSPFRAVVATGLPAVGEQVDAIALCNVSGVSAADARLLQQHLAKGAGLAIFLGDQTHPSEWSAAAGVGIFPSGLRAFPEPSPAFLRNSDLTQPAMAGLTAESLRGLGLLPLMHRFTWPTDVKWKNLLEFDDDSPLLAVSTNGKVAVLNHPVNRQGSDLPLNSAFVPFMQGLFASLASSDAAHPATAIRPLNPGLDERRPPGIYQEPAGITLITADIAESDIANADEKSFRLRLGLPAADAPAPELIEPAAQANSDHQREGELWPWILAALLALLIVESGLAARRIRQPVTVDAHVN